MDKEEILLKAQQENKGKDVADMEAQMAGAWFAYIFGVIGIILLMFVMPVILNIVISELFRKKGWIKFGDMKLPE